MAVAAPPCLQESPLQSILVFRALQVGDMLCAVPALRALRAAQPAAHIRLIGLPWAAQFAARYPSLIDDFIAFPGHPSLPERPAATDDWPDFIGHMRSLRADLALQLHGSGDATNPIVKAFNARWTAGHSRHPERDGPGFFAWPEQGHESERLLSLITALGGPRADPSLWFPLTEADRGELGAADVAPQPEGQGYICVHAGARDPRRCWPAHCFAAVADALAEEFGLAVLLTGSANERAIADSVVLQMRHPAINAALPISIGAMAALISGARLLVCNDTAASHLADALRVPSVVVFGHADMERWRPRDSQRHRGIRDPGGQHAALALREARDLLQLGCPI